MESLTPRDLQTIVRLLKWCHGTTSMYDMKDCEILIIKLERIIEQWKIYERNKTQT